MATKDQRELIVCCGLGRTTLPIAPLSRTLVAVQSNSRNDCIRRREEVTLKLMKLKTKYKQW